MTPTVPEPMPIPADDRDTALAARLAPPRMARERATVAAMLHIYCAVHHRADRRDGRDMRALCAECQGLLDYASKRLALCPYGAEKPTCVNCPIHCYGRRQREAMREVMRYAGPRMLKSHPLLAIAHVIDGRRPAPPKANAVKESSVEKST
jgi:hypothetical protein